jgi:hypothetical protein
MRAIEACRTPQLGGHLDRCPDCDFERPAYNSCRNRHCPKCQSLAQARWIQQRLARILPVLHFHVVFTLPAELRAIARRNRKLLFGLLFQAAAKTLLDLGDDPHRLGAHLGITAVLHTWTRKLEFHPHLHCIVTSGGLSPNGDRWLSIGRRYLFPVAVLGQLFRGKFLAGLRRLRDEGQLDLADRSQADFDALLDKLYRIPWHVYVKRPFAGPDQLFRYLGRYTHRVGISNQRIQTIDQDGVRFATKDGAAVTLPPLVFIRRFLDHVLPYGFTKVRHFGLYAAGNVTTKLEVARALLPSSRKTRSLLSLPWQDLLHALTGFQPMLCPRCGSVMERVSLPRGHGQPIGQDTS